jgi:hypothetical protein
MMNAVRVFFLAVLAAVLTVPCHPSARGEEPPEGSFEWFRKRDEERRNSDELWNKILDFDKSGGSGGLLPPLTGAGADCYAVITYSPATGKYGSSRGWHSLGSARRMAMIEGRAPDAQPVVWVKNGYCALAVGKNGVFATGYAATLDQAKAIALGQCRKYSSDCAIATWVFSGRQNRSATVGGAGPAASLVRTTRQ